MLNQNSRGLYAQVLSVGTLILAAIAVISRLVNFSGAISDLAFWALLVLAVILALLSILANQPAKGNPSIRRDESGNLVVDYRDDGVTVTVPPQGKNNSMQIQKLPSVPIEKLRSANDEFSPARFVINVEAVDANHPGIVLTDFSPPISLRVTYQASDWARAKAYLLKIAEQESKVLNPGEPTPAQIAAAMQLGFWDGCRWVLFTKEKHNFRILPNNQPETGGVEIVDISKWGDPPISHGP